MLHAHSVAATLRFTLALTADALGNLDGIGIHRIEADRLMDGYLTADAQGSTAELFFIKSEHLTKGTHVQPFFTGCLGEFIRRPDIFQEQRAILQADEVVIPASSD